MFGRYEGSDVIIRTYVNSIKIYNNNTFEYNIRVSETADTINMTEHNLNWSAQKKDAILKIDNSNAVVLTEIQVSTEEARQYARSRGRKLNTLRWSIPTLKWLQISKNEKSEIKFSGFFSVSVLK